MPKSPALADFEPVRGTKPQLHEDAQVCALLACLNNEDKLNTPVATAFVNENVIYLTSHYLFELFDRYIFHGWQPLQLV